MSKTNLQPRPRGVNPDRLDPRHRQFAELYLANGLNGSEAAKELGYKHPATEAAKLLKKPLVKAYVEKSLATSENAAKLKREVVLEQLLFNLVRKGSDFVDKNGEILPIHLMSELAQSCIDGIEQEVFVNEETGDRRVKTKLKLVPKASAMDMSMRYLKLLGSDSKETTNNTTVNVNLGNMLAGIEAARKAMVIDDDVIESGAVKPKYELLESEDESYGEEADNNPSDNE